jgi:hypothetical protein
MDRCVDLEDRGLLTEAGRRAFEKAFEYEMYKVDGGTKHTLTDKEV